MSTDFDYIIVGSGAGGSALAYRLGSAGHDRVLVLEGGVPDTDPLHRVPLAHFLTEADERYTYRYPTAPVASAGQTWIRGRVAGGSTTVNGLIYSRGQQADFDRLAAHTGSAHWGWHNILAAYRAIEDHELGASAGRGSGGPFGVRVNGSGPDDELAERVFAAAKHLGWRQVDDTNDSEAGDAERIGRTPTASRGGVRHSAATAFLRPALLAGVTLETGVRVRRVVFSHGRATGVEALQNGRPTRFHARKEVILACGTVESPLLLERSGIGRPDLLRRLGIPVVAESPNVGERVLEHSMTMLQVRFDRDLGSAADLAEGLASIASGGGHLETVPRESLGRPGYDFVFYAKSDPRLERPDLVGHIAGYTIDPTAGAAPVADPGLLLATYQLRPETVSSIHSAEDGETGTPDIRPHYLETDTDQQAASAVLPLMRNLVAAEPLAEVIAGEDFPGAAVPSAPEASLAYARQAGAPGFHAVGSCAMGGSAEDVLRDDLRVRGVDGLRVVDASALPFQVSANSAAPVMALAWLAADLLI